MLTLLIAGHAVLLQAIGVQTQLKTPDKVLSAPLVQVGAARELRDGRVVFLDIKDRLVRVANFETGIATPLGKNGKGPGEYTLPAGLVPLPDGRTYIHDPSNRRFLLVEADGTVGDAVSFESTGGPVELMMTYVPVSDLEGRLYFEAPPFDAILRGDSIPVVRWAKGQTKIDTIGYVDGPKLGKPMFEGPRMPGMPSTSGTVMFAPEEAWAIDSVGRFARITPKPYQVLWFDALDKVQAGRVVAYEPVPVSDEEKAELKEVFRRSVADAMAVVGDNNRGDGDRLIEVPDLVFPDTKPPFPGKAAPMLGPKGELWIARSVRYGTGARYDRFDAKGNLIGQVTLNPNSVIVALGKSAVYVARKGTDGLTRLERYRWPS